MDVTARMPTFPQSTSIHCLVRYLGHWIIEHGRATGGGYAIARTGISSSLVISCGASVCDDWNHARDQYEICREVVEDVRDKC